MILEHVDRVGIEDHEGTVFPYARISSAAGYAEWCGYVSEAEEAPAIRELINGKRLSVDRWDHYVPEGGGGAFAGATWVNMVKGDSPVEALVNSALQYRSGIAGFLMDGRTVLVNERGGYMPQNAETRIVSTGPFDTEEWNAVADDPEDYR